MTLVVDCGNSRLKWATADGARLTVKGSASLLDSGTDAVAALGRAAGPAAAHALVANVAGERMAGRIEATLGGAGLKVRFVEVASSAFGIHCGYHRPETLGVDRWLAMIACRRVVTGAFVAVGAGTAVTIDAVDAGGRHLGGLILAGERLTGEALAANTSRIGLAPRAGRRPAGLELLGRSTADAVAHGSRLALAAAIDRTVAEVAQALGETPEVLLTGGDAGLIEDWLETRVAIRADLVLEGLAVVALGQESR